MQAQLLIRTPDGCHWLPVQEPGSGSTAIESSVCFLSGQHTPHAVDWVAKQVCNDGTDIPGG